MIRTIKSIGTSNFAKPNFECIHNLYYWQYNDYLSFGTAAHSFINGNRWWNFSSLKKYGSEIKQLGHAVRGSEQLSETQMADEYIMLALRSNGLKIDDIKSVNADWYFEKKKIIDSFIDERYLEESEGIISCTQKGYLICDEIIKKLL